MLPKGTLSKDVQGPKDVENVPIYFPLQASRGCSIEIYVTEVLFNFCLDCEPLRVQHVDSLFPNETAGKGYFINDRMYRAAKHFRLDPNGSAHGQVPATFMQ